MSEYADITIKKLTLFSFRNYLNDSIVSLFFTSKDLFVNNNARVDLEDEDAGVYTQYIYKTSVKCAKERLDACGFTISALEKLFVDSGIQLIDYSSFLHHLHVEFETRDEVAKERFAQKVTFKKWKNAMQKIVSYELQNGNIQWHGNSSEIGINTECDKIIYYALKDQDAESFYGLNLDAVPLSYVFRLILENCCDDDEIVLDFSNLQYWDEDCIEKAISATNNVEKNIVLVEGTSDKDILEFSMSMIYPHLSDLFYFMDFEDANGGKREGGTSFVIKSLKTFYFSKLKANFIAIFDNDAEGFDSRCTLLREIKDWPDNYRILLYPETELFNKYPTLAPNGKIIDDNIINKACSIELYLPDSIIKTKDAYYPIEWEARKTIRDEKGEKKYLYQGVISQKDTIKKSFHSLRRKIENGSAPFVIENWSRMKKLLDTIVFAFRE